MSEAPKRRFWQVHLSTVLVLSFATGGLLCVNLRPRSVLFIEDEYRKTAQTRLVAGWPAIYDSAACNIINEWDEDLLQWKPRPNDQPQYYPAYFDYVHLGFDVVVGGALLLSLCVLSEWWIRRVLHRATVVLTGGAIALMVVLNLIETQEGFIGWPIRYNTIGVEIPGALAIAFFVWPVNLVVSMLSIVLTGYCSERLRKRES